MLKILGSALLFFTLILCGSILAGWTPTYVFVIFAAAVLYAIHKNRKHLIVPISFCLLLATAWYLHNEPSLLSQWLYSLYDRVLVSKKPKKIVMQRLYWPDYTADSFDGGSGTEEEPYRIATAEQLSRLAKEVNEGEKYEGVYFKLSSDINLSGKDWVPIGDVRGKSNAFRGIFDGNGKVIANMEIRQPQTFYRGFFGNLESADLKNIVLADVAIAEDRTTEQAGTTGALASYVKNSKIGNCIVTGNIDGRRYVGGLVGTLLDSTLQDCVVRGSVSGNVDIGGLIYGAVNSEIRNCWVSADIFFRGMIPFFDIDPDMPPSGARSIFRQSYGPSAYKNPKGGWGAVGRISGSRSLFSDNLILADISGDLVSERKYLEWYPLGEISSQDLPFSVLGSFSHGDGLAVICNNIVLHNIDIGLSGTESEDCILLQSNIEIEMPPSQFLNFDIPSGSLVGLSHDLGKDGFKAVPANLAGLKFRIDGNILYIDGIARLPAGSYPVALNHNEEIRFVNFRILREALIKPF